MGTGTTAVIAKSMNRFYLGSEISKQYCEIAESKIKEKTSMPLFEKQNYYPLSLF